MIAEYIDVHISVNGCFQWAYQGLKEHIRLLATHDDGEKPIGWGVMQVMSAIFKARREYDRRPGRSDEPRLFKYIGSRLVERAISDSKIADMRLSSDEFGLCVRLIGEAEVYQHPEAAAYLRTLLSEVDETGSELDGTYSPGLRR
jgi:hypothetical protein